MKNIVFVCNSSYQVLVSTIMCHLEYANDFNIIALDEYFYKTVVNCYDFENNPYFDKVICLHDATLHNDVDVVLNNNPDKIHLYNWGNECSRLIYENCKCPVDITDEGIGSYQLQKMWLYRGITFEKISAIRLLAPEFSQDKNLGIPILKIHLESIFQNKEQKVIFLKNINKLFRYKAKKIPNIFYFDRYFVSGNMMPTTFERRFLEQLIPILSKYSFCVKTHPSENMRIAEYRYRGMNVNFWSDNRTPWEVILLNQDLGSVLVLVSVNSTPIILSKLIGACLGIKVVSVCLIDLVKEYVDLEERFVENLLEKYNEAFPKNQIYRTKDINQLDNFLDNIAELKNISSSVVKYENNQEDELEWLRKEYLWYSKAFGNMLDTVRISAYDIRNNLLFSDERFFAWSDKHVLIKFNITDAWQYSSCITVNIGIRKIINFAKNIEIRSKGFCKKYGEECDLSSIWIEMDTLKEYLEITFDLDLPLLPYNYRDFVD